MAIGKAAYFGRDARGRIILDVVSMEKPAASIRVEFTPKAVADFCDRGYELAEEHAHNLAAYGFEVACGEEVLP